MGLKRRSTTEQASFLCVCFFFCVCVFFLIFFFLLSFFHLLLLLSIPTLRWIAVSVACESVVAFFISCFHSR